MKELIEEFIKTYCPECKSYVFCGGECTCVQFEKFLKEKKRKRSNMTTQELADKSQKMINHLTSLINDKSMSYDDELCIKNIIKQYKIIKEKAESGITNLMEYSVGYNYAAYLKTNLPWDIKSLKQYAVKYTLDDIKELEDFSFYHNNKYTTINPNEL